MVRWTVVDMEGGGGTDQRRGSGLGRVAVDYHHLPAWGAVWVGAMELVGGQHPGKDACAGQEPGSG